MRHLPLLLGLILLAACTTTKPPPGSFDDAEEAITAAENAGAEDHSPVELKFAREKLQAAHDAMASKQYDQAIYLVEQSQINSELAIEKTRAAEIRARVTELSRENEILREDYETTYGEAFE
jgi:Asp-tRNA(Asn)/Glu-tRNA(Gln) amidotransferase A subunit family amidase